MADITTETLYNLDVDTLDKALALMNTGLTAAEALIAAGATVYGTVTVETVEEGS